MVAAQDLNKQTQRLRGAALRGMLVGLLGVVVWSSPLGLRLEEDIGLAIGPTSNAQIDFAGSVSFAGALDIDLTGGAAPAPCERFDIFTYLSFNGGFATITGPDFGGQTFALDLQPTLGQLETPGSGC